MFDGLHRGHQRVSAHTHPDGRRRACRVGRAERSIPTRQRRCAAARRHCCATPRSASRTSSGSAWTTSSSSALTAASPTRHRTTSWPGCAQGRELMGLVMTAESAFGRDRSGSLPEIRALAGRLGFRIIEVPHLVSAGAPLSSTRLRGLLTAGPPGRGQAAARAPLRGDRRGRARRATRTGPRLSDSQPRTSASRSPCRPTGSMPSKPAGAAAIRSTRRAAPMPWPRSACGLPLAAARAYSRPTCSMSMRISTARRLRVEFVRRLRARGAFASSAALVRQMERDAARARALLRPV